MWHKKRKEHRIFDRIMLAMITRQLILKTVNVLKPIKQTFLQVLK